MFLQLRRIIGWAELQRSQYATANHSYSMHLIHHHSRQDVLHMPKHLIHHHIYQEVVHQNQHILLGKVLPSMSTTVVRVRASCLLCLPSWVFKVLVKWFVHHSAVINGTPWNILSPSNISNNLVYLHHAKRQSWCQDQYISCIKHIWGNVYQNDQDLIQVSFPFTPSPRKHLEKITQVRGHTSNQCTP